MTENNKKLKACPFCGGEAILVQLSYGVEPWNVVCECGMAATGAYENELDALKEWNTRHNEAPTGEICNHEWVDNIHYGKNYPEDANDFRFACQPLKCKFCGKGKPVINNFLKPTGEIGELIERIDEAIDSIKFEQGEGSITETLTDCKSQLQQAQKMREILQNLFNACKCEMNMNGLPHEWTKDSPMGQAEQALNHEG